MPTSAKNHSEMQTSVCLLCFKKPKTLRNITPATRQLIKEFIPDLENTEDWQWLPTVICGGCYLELSKIKKNPNHTLSHIDYKSLLPPVSHHTMVTRSRL